MSEYRTLLDQTGEFFRSSTPERLNTDDLAQFAARRLSMPKLAGVIAEISRSKTLVEQVSAISYKVTPHFLKLLLHRDSTGWGIRLHSFEHSGINPLVEPWHEHRWIYGSSVLTGRLTTENGKVAMVEPSAYEDVSSGLFYKYEVPDKRVTGVIQPLFVGRCVLQHRFRSSVTAGQSYSSHPDLAHRLVITQPTITAIVTSPDCRNTASFIETDPLSYSERPTQPTLGFDETRELLRIMHGKLLDTTPSPANMTTSPFPDLLKIVP